MRVAKLQMRVAMLVGLALAASACHSAKKPVPVLSAKAKTPPALTSKAPAPPPPQTSPPPPQEPAPKPAPVETATENKIPFTSAASESDAVGALVTRAEKQYQAGLDAFHIGQNDVAKQDFDNAINALLGSNLDIRSDDRLEAEFDRIVEGVNHLDLS